MPFPGGTYIQQISDWFTRQELDQFYSLLTGWLSKQHKDDGSHGAITADSVVATGVGTFNGNITADADAPLPVVTGQIGLIPGAGINIGGKWYVRAGVSSSPGNNVDYQLEFWDLTNDSTAAALRFVYDSGNTIWRLMSGTSTTSFALGTSSRRVSSIDVLTANVITALNVNSLFFTGTDTLTLAAGNNNDQVLNTGVSLLTITSNGAGSTLTGMTGGVAGRIVILLNIGSAGNLTITAEDGLSLAANRFVPAATIASGELVMAVYTNRWRLITGI